MERATAAPPAESATAEMQEVVLATAISTKRKIHQVKSSTSQTASCTNIATGAMNALKRVRHEPSFNDIRICKNTICDELAIIVWDDSTLNKRDIPPIRLSKGHHNNQFKNWLNHPRFPRDYINKLIFSNTDIKMFPDIGHFFPQLTELFFCNCKNLVSFPNICSFAKLNALYLADSMSLKKVVCLKRHKRLEILNLHGCKSLENADLLAHLPILKSLSLRNCVAIEKLPLLHLPYLQIGDFDGCKCVPKGLKDICTLEVDPEIQEMIKCINKFTEAS